MSDQTTGIWEGAGGTIGAILLIGIIYGMYSRYGSTPSVGAVSFVKSITAGFVNLIPISMLMFGIVTDVFQGTTRFGIPSYATLSAMLLFGVIGQIVGSGMGLKLSTSTSVPDTMVWCSLPGLESVESPWFPMALLTITVVPFYYLWWALNTAGQSPTMPAIIWGATTAVYLFVFYAGDCGSSFFPIGGNVFVNLLITIILGMIVSASAFGAAKAYNLNPYMPNPTAPASAPAPGVQSPTPGTSQPVQDGELTFVADLYKNGQLVTESISK